MELSVENIEDLAIAMAENAVTIATMDSVAFENKSDFSNLDVVHAASDPQECLLNTSIEQISSSCSLNDILDDICEMNKTMELDHTAANASNSQLPFPTMTDLSMGSPPFYHMPDIGIQQGDYSPVDCSFSNQTDFLHTLGQWPEYLSSLPPALDNLQEVPQLTVVPTPPPLPPPPLSSTAAPQEPSPPDVPAVSVNLEEFQLVSSAPVVPMQFFHNFQFDCSPPLMPQSEPPNPSTQFLATMEKNLNIVMTKDQSAVPPKKRPRLQKQLPCFGWARVVPRKAFVQPTEVMILRPLRTRKAASSRQNFDLSSYFDTSAISIPMIRERPRSKNSNRRKQKLRTIPGAENFIFEVQLQPTNDGEEQRIGENNKFTDVNNNADQLYPETEIPELDEIFKRKRRGLNTRRNPQPQDEMKTPTQNHSVEEENAVTSEPPLLEKERAEVIESNSDMDSDDAPLTAVKSMKCQNCRKLFKTCRSLRIHSKRCEAMRHTPVKDKPPDNGQTRSTRQINVQSSSSKENIAIKGEEKKPSVQSILTARPLTRSQTNAAKRGAAICDVVAAKRKC